MTDMSDVTPEHRIGKGGIFLNSVAGTIRFIPRREADLNQFRDTFLNRFHVLSQMWERGVSKDAEFFQLYEDIRKFKWKKSRIKYKANLHTRIRSKFEG